MVAAEPDLGDVGELVVFSGLLRDEMAVVVYNRLFFSAFVIELAGIFVFKKKVVVDEIFHILK